MKEIHNLAESGARYKEMPHVIEITLPMLCNYLPRWWERGLENFPEMEDQLCTSVTSEQLNQLLGSIMKIVVNNLGIDEASWMKRLAGQWAEDSHCYTRRLLFHILYISYLEETMLTLPAVSCVPLVQCSPSPLSAGRNRRCLNPTSSPPWKS